MALFRQMERQDRAQHEGQLYGLGIRAKLDKGTYVPRPVKRVEIPKLGGELRHT